MSFTTLDTKELREDEIKKWRGDIESKNKLSELFNDNPKMFDAEKSYFYLNRDKSISLYLDNKLYNIDGDDVLSISELKKKYNVVDIIIDRGVKVAIVGTHNFRLQCFFTKMMYNQVKSYKNLKFKNCAMIRCYNQDKDIHFEMIYEGELSKDENNDIKKYWNIESFDDASHSMKNKNLPLNTEIVLIRHGKGIHNGVSLFKKMLDPAKYIDASLTQEGFYQANNAAYKLFTFFNTSGSKYDKLIFGASHLKRSQQTVAVIEIYFKQKSPIVIVPCTHELLYTSDGECDGSIKQLGGTSENAPSCKKNFSIESSTEYSIESDLCKQIKKLCDTCSEKSGDYFEVDWEQYIDFYSKNGRCRKINMIDQIIKCLLLKSEIL